MALPRGSPRWFRRAFASRLDIIAPRRSPFVRWSSAVSDPPVLLAKVGVSGPLTGWPQRFGVPRELWPVRGLPAFGGICSAIASGSGVLGPVLPGRASRGSTTGLGSGSPVPESRRRRNLDPAGSGDLFRPRLPCRSSVLSASSRRIAIAHAALRAFLAPKRSSSSSVTRRIFSRSESPNVGKETVLRRWPCTSCNNPIPVPGNRPSRGLLLTSSQAEVHSLPQLLCCGQYPHQRI